LLGVPHVRPARANVGFLGSVPDVPLSSSLKIIGHLDILNPPARAGGRSLAAVLDSLLAGGRSLAAVLYSLLLGVPHVRPARANVGFLGSVPDVPLSSAHKFI
jgi:hypothetical protein